MLQSIDPQDKSICRQLAVHFPFLNDVPYPVNSTFGLW